MPGPMRSSAEPAAASAVVPADREDAQHEEYDGARHRLTGRGALLAVAFLLFGVAVAVPLRQLVEQRAEIAEARQANERTRAAVLALEQTAKRWQDPAYIAAQARARLHLVMPGETAFIVLADEPPADAGSGAATDPGAGAGAAADPGAGAGADADPFRLPAAARPAGRDTWYERVWESFAVAGGPTAPVAPAP